MTYAVRREKIFALQDPLHPDCTPPRIQRSDHRLKAFPSNYDDRTWELSEEQQYRALYDLVSGSKSCLSDLSPSHKYVPLEDLIRILMGEKDDLIKRLQDELRRCCKDQFGDKGEEGERGYRDNAPDDVIAALTEELNQSREMLRKAMHKLQNIDDIVNENKTLQCRLRCSEEKIKYLEEKKKCLESELEDLRSKSQIQIDLQRAQEKLLEVSQQRDSSSGNDVDTLTLERDRLQEKVIELEKELELSKKKEAEIQMLRQKSTKGLDKEEISIENECYRKKLASMRCLEKQIQDLKKHGRALADKYKREAQKAAEQMNRMCQAAKELEALRQERDSLRHRVKELSSYECQYNALQRKLRCVEEVIAENEVLNSKMAALEKLEKENEYLKCRLNQIQEMENTAAEDKERIMQLQCAVADQEEEMKELLCQIERLTSGTHQEELERLRCELYEKSSKLKLCEEQLAEIPMLEAEIDELRTKLQTCCREFPDKKINKGSSQKIEVRLPAATTGIRAKYKLQDQKSSSIIKRRCDEKFGGTSGRDSCQDITKIQQEFSQSTSSGPGLQSDAMTCEEVQSLLQSSKGIISSVLEDMIEHQKEMEELEKRNKEMKDEIEILKAKVGSDSGDIQQGELRKALEEAKEEILRLREGGGSSEDDVEMLKELNSQMKAELQAACEGLKQVSILEQKLEAEHKARCMLECQLKRGKKGNVPSDGNCEYLQREVDDLKCQIAELNKLTNELKKENALLRELQKPRPDFSKELEEKCAMENLLSLLQAELDAFKGQKLSDECEALRNELKRVMEQNCQLKALVDCYRQRLDLEKKSQELGGQILRETKEKTPVVTPSGRVIYPDEESERDKAPIVTPSGRIITSEEGSERGRTPTTTPSGRVITSEEGSERGRAPTTTSSGRVITSEKGLERDRAPTTPLSEYVISSAEKFERGKTPTTTPSEYIISSAEGSERGRTPTTTPSGRVIYSQEGLERYKAPTTPLSEYVISSAEGSERGRTPTTTPSEYVISSAEEAEGGKTAIRTPSERVVSSIEGLERRKTPIRTPSERVISSTEGSEKGKTPIRTPSGRVVSSTEGSERGKTPIRTPSGRVVSITEGSERGKTPIRTRSGRVVSSSEGSEKGRTPTTTPSRSIIQREEGSDSEKPPIKTPSGRVILSEEGREKVKTPMKSPSGRTVLASDATEKDQEKQPSTILKGDKDDKLAPAKKDVPAEVEKAVKKQESAPGVGGKSESEKAELNRLKRLLEENQEKLQAKEEEAKAAQDKIGALEKQIQKFKEKEDRGKRGEDEKDDLEALKQRLKQLEAENAGKLKALMDQHEKELAEREKAYNDNLNAMKAGYETDIRKLADRHKQSVMKLQGLHEDEVQELNSTYESQMEMMQTQSEAAMNDVARGSAAKLRKLTDEHARALQEKDKQMEKLRDGLTKSQLELEALKNMVSSKGDLSSLKAKHSRELSAIKRGSQRKLSLLKEKYDEEKRKYETELEMLRRKIKENVCDCKSRRRDRKPRDPGTPLDFIDVIEKILDQGLDALTFNEIALVHRKACCALEGIVMNSDVIPSLEPPVGDVCPHMPLIEADKQQLLRKIFALQNGIQEKQRITQETIINMEVAIKKERCRLMELKNLLCNEQRKNSELRMVIQSQSQVQTNLKKERDELGNQASLHQSLFAEKSKELVLEKENKKSLESEVEKLKFQVKRLCFALEMSKGKSECQQSDQIEMLQLKLEQAQNQERKLVLQLENEAKCRMQLQCQVQALRQSFRQMVSLPSVETQISVPQNPLDDKSAKEMKNLDQRKEKKKKSKPSKNKKK